MSFIDINDVNLKRYHFDGSNFDCVVTSAVIPCLSPVVGFQPSPFIRAESKSFEVTPFKLSEENKILPLKPTTSAITSASCLIEMLLPLPAFRKLVEFGQVDCHVFLLTPKAVKHALARSST